MLIPFTLSIISPSLFANDWGLPDWAQKIYKHTQLDLVQCEAGPAACHGLGILIPHNDLESAGNCKASLVAPDLVATNRHCIPKILAASLLEDKPRPSPCSEALFFQFSGPVGQPQEAAACKEIVFISKAQDIDLALIRLAGPVKTHLPLKDRASEFQEGLKVRVPFLKNSDSAQSYGKLCTKDSHGSLFCPDEKTSPNFFKRSKGFGFIFNKHNEWIGFVDSSKTNGAFLSQTLLNEIKSSSNYKPSQTLESKRKDPANLWYKSALEQALNPNFNSILTPLSCEDSSECHPAFGLLHTDEECPVVLVQPDLVMTPRTCLPKKLQSDSQPRDALDVSNYVLFPLSFNNRYEPEVSYLLEVLPGKKELGPFALIKLVTPIRSRQAISAVARSDWSTEENRALRIGFNARYRYRSKQCEVVKNGTHYAWSKTPQDPVVVLADCDVDPGDSGTPVLDDTGHMIGIIFGQFGKSQSHAFRLAFEAGILRPVMQDGRVPRIRHLGTASSFFSLSTLSELAERPTLLAQQPGSSAAFDSSELRAIANREFNQIQNQLPSDFEWELRNPIGVLPTLFEPLPKCVKSSAVSELKNPGATRSYPVQLPAWAAPIDTTLRVVGPLSKVAPRGVRSVLTLEEIPTNSGNKYSRYEWQYFDNQQRTQGFKILPICSTSQ